MKFIYTSFFIIWSYSSYSQSSHIDIIKYHVDVLISDSTDVIFVKETIELTKNSSPDIELDLYRRDKDGLGMTIDKNFGVELNGEKVEFDQLNEKLIIHTKVNSADTLVLKFNYSGVPQTGLIIGENKFGNRTFFGDNWPNRAHHWIACIDHPMEKAMINFTVTAPDHYDCVATGLLKKKELSHKNATHYFESNILLPTKVMVIGLAEFGIQDVEYQFPVQNWVYTDDSALTISDLSTTQNILDFYIDKIGPYPFEKLFNVQSTTQFGGMENAGNIFYDENAFSGKGEMEALIAHEIAHQWFGNSASESDWRHLWLSEGFATYMTDLYFQSTHGEKAMQERLINERKRVLQFGKTYKHPVIDTTYSSLMDLLNPNSYQKGAWILHMLRSKVGDSNFWQGIAAYYQQYAFGNASSNDFRKIMEETSGQDLSEFFTQWLNQYGHPILQIEINSNKKDACILVEQTQKTVFKFPLDIEFEYADGAKEIQHFEIVDKSQVYKLDNTRKIKNIVIDPGVKLLYETYND